MNAFIVVMVLVNTWIFSRFVRNHVEATRMQEKQMTLVSVKLQKISDTLKKLLDAE